MYIVNKSSRKCREITTLYDWYDLKVQNNLGVGTNNVK